MISKLKTYISDSNRFRKFQMAISKIKVGDKIIDIGVDPHMGGNTNYFEKWFNLPNSLTCLGIKNDFTNFVKTFPEFELLLFDGINFPVFKEKFDFAFSNAVIEHVGNFEIQSQWLFEISKITKELFITTPNRWLPFETHTQTFFIHWFPDKIRDYIYCKIDKKSFTNGYMWLLSESNFKKLLNESGFEIVTFHKNKFFFFTIDFVAICRSTS